MRALHVMIALLTVASFLVSVSACGSPDCPEPKKVPLASGVFQPVATVDKEFAFGSPTQVRVDMDAQTVVYKFQADGKTYQATYRLSTR